MFLPQPLKYIVSIAVDNDIDLASVCCNSGGVGGVFFFFLALILMPGNISFTGSESRGKMCFFSTGLRLRACFFGSGFRDKVGSGIKCFFHWLRSQI